MVNSLQILRKARQKAYRAGSVDTELQERIFLPAIALIPGLIQGLKGQRIDALLQKTLPKDLIAVKPALSYLLNCGLVIPPLLKDPKASVLHADDGFFRKLIPVPFRHFQIFRISNVVGRTDSGCP